MSIVESHTMGSVKLIVTKRMINIIENIGINGNLPMFNGILKCLGISGSRKRKAITEAFTSMKAIMQASEDAVSYTHLTLPTICSV